MVTPAEGPSLPTAPAGKWIWTSVRSRRSIPSSDVRKYYITVKKRDKQAVSQFLVLVNSMGTGGKLLLLEIFGGGNCYIVFIFTITFGSINIAMQNHRNVRISEKIRDGFRCQLRNSSKWWFAHPEPKKKRGAQPRKYRIFLSPAGSSLAEELERSQSLDLPMELLTQELKDEVVRTRFDWAFLSTAVGLKTAAAFPANWK